MSILQRLVLATCIVGGLPLAFPSTVAAQAKQCSTERPANARSFWSYRLIDGRKCWYEGKPMLSKSLLHWAPVRTVKKDVPKREPILPADRYNFLDAQASAQEHSDSFEARWSRSFLEAFGK
jgi:hypothetical protein